TFTAILLAYRAAPRAGDSQCANHISTVIKRNAFTGVRMRAVIVAITVLLTSSLALFGQQAPPSVPAAQNAAAPQSEAAKIKTLEDRVAALEAQVTALTAALTASSGAAAPAPAQQPAQPGAAQPAESQAAAAGAPSYPTPDNTTLGGATGQAKALNPDISVIGDFIGDAGHNPYSAFPSMSMHEAEVAFQSVVDPYARADFFLSFGEEGVNLEEGYLTLTALPHSFVAKVGKMRAAFGKVNTLHNHVLPWADRPLMTYNLVGGEDGINDAGVSVQRILPAPKWLFLEGTAQMFRGDSADVFTAPNKNDLSVVGHLRGYHDLTDNTNLYGVDATLRWKPLQRAIYHSFIARAEAVWSEREELDFERKAFGWYTS